MQRTRWYNVHEKGNVTSSLEVHEIALTFIGTYVVSSFERPSNGNIQLTNFRVNPTEVILVDVLNI